MKNIILGTVQFGVNYGINNHVGMPERTEVFEIFDHAFSHGVRTLDTADAYGKSLSLIAAYHRQSKNRFAINTKFGNAIVDKLAENIEKQIVELDIASFETFFFHSFNTYASSKMLVAKLVELKEAGKISKIGVSIYSNEELASVTDDPLIDVIQTPFNLLDNHMQRGQLLENAGEKGKTIQVRSVFLQGLFFSEVSRLNPKLYPVLPWLEKINHIIHENESGLGKEAVCLLYPSSKQYIDEVIIGVDNLAHLKSNLQVLNNKLPASLEAQLDEIAVDDQALLFPINWNT